MTYRSFIARDLLSDFDRLHRELLTAFDSESVNSQPFPSLSATDRADAIEITALAPGLAPEQIEVQFDDGRLTISGERKVPTPEGITPRFSERFVGQFRRSVALPSDVDASQASASYRDGVLRIRVPRNAAALPRRITVN